MELHLRFIGVLLIALALLHLVFPRYFDWENEFNSVSLINKEMMYVHTFFIGLVVLLMGVLCLSSAVELTQTVLGKRISFGIGIFWGIRLFIQFFGYSAVLWKGKKLETAVHILFSFLWIYLTFVFFYISFRL